MYFHFENFENLQPALSPATSALHLPACPAAGAGKYCVEALVGVSVLAASNRPDLIDPALLRPGRFDRQVVVPNPDVVGREKILKVHMRKTPLAEGVDARTIARGTPGFSAAARARGVLRVWCSHRVATRTSTQPSPKKAK